MSRVIFKISGKRVSLEPEGRSWKFFRRPGGWVIAERALPGGGLEVKRFMISERGSRMSASLDGRLWSGEVTQAAGTGLEEGAAGGDSDLVAQFPGKVRKILVKEGALVAQGDGLVLIEAMKMEFAVKAPYKGKVLKILVAEGQQLAPGDRFVEMEVTHGSKSK